MLEVNSSPSLKSQIQHELITPLSCILGLLHCLQETKINHEQADYLHDIQVSVESLLDIENTVGHLVSYAIDKEGSRV